MMMSYESVVPCFCGLTMARWAGPDYWISIYLKASLDLFISFCHGSKACDGL